MVNQGQQSYAGPARPIDPDHARGDNLSTFHDAEAILAGLMARPAPLKDSPESELARIVEASHASDAQFHLLNAETRYRALIESIPAITFLAAMDDSVHELYVSPQIEAVLGFSQKEWVENPVLWYTQLHPDDRERWHVEFAKTVLLGVPFRSEYRFLARNGRVVWIRGEAQLIRDNAGSPLFLQGMAFDITEQKRAEETIVRSREDLETEVIRRTAELDASNRALQSEILERRRAELTVRDRESRLRSILDSVVDGIIVIDEAGSIESFNPAAERIFGYPSAGVIGRNVKMLMPPPYHDEHDGYIAHFAATNIRKVIGIGRDVVGLRHNGETFPMELAVSETLTTEGRRFTGIVRDVTERKRAEAALVQAKLTAELSSQHKSEFLANMSHEIRTPMNGVIGMTDLALSTDLNSEQREYLEIAKNSADALLVVINDILDFSKIEAGKLDLDPIDFSLRKTLSDALKPMALRAHAKGVELACHVLPDVPDRIIGDPDRLRQILTNLVGNALKFTTDGEVFVQVDTTRPGTETQPSEPSLDDPSWTDDLLRFSVRDTGIGISAEKQQVIFEPFAQADGSTTRKFGGTGLGLAICRNLVGLMGGTLWVESEPGSGTTFGFTARFPRSRKANGPALASGVARLKGLSVLVVDDNATHGKLLEHELTQLEIHPTVVDSGPAALDAISRATSHRTPFSIILLDASMPGMSGFSVVRRMNQDPTLSCPTIMMLSSAAQLADAAVCHELGLSTFLVKPIFPDELIEAFRKMLGNPSESLPEPAASQPDPAAPLAARVRVLVAEDNPVNQRLAVRLLEKNGYDVVVVNNGKEAVELLETRAFDVVLMDLQMPVMDGFAATAQIRSHDATRERYLPVIALTANAMKGDREHCLASGFDDYVSKPIKWEELNSAITRQWSAVSPAAPPANGPTPLEKSPQYLSALEQLGGDRDLLREVAAVFLADYPRMLREIARAVEEQDPRALRLAAHSLRGAVSYLGATEAIAAAGTLESMSRDANLDGAREVLARLESLLTALQPIVLRIANEI